MFGRSATHATVAHDCVSGIFFFLPNCQSRIPLPLLNINAKATITSTNTHLLLTQTFKVPEHSDIKTAKYTFPLYAHSAVSSFTAHIGPNKVLHAKIEKKKEAREKYDAAVKAGKTAALMNEVTAEIFTMELGNLPANTEIKVVLGVIGELKGAGEDDTKGEHTLRYTLPMTIAPKYGEPPKELGWSSTAYQAGKQGLEIEVEVLSPESIKGISSPTHPVALGFGEETEGGLQKMSATLSQMQSHNLDKDFILEVKLGKKSDSIKPWAILEKHPTIPGQSAVMVSFLPRLKLRKVKPEVIFVLDQSGSMFYNIQSLRSAMEVFLKSLAAGVKFNICSFGSRYEFMFSDEKSKPYTEDTMEQALKYVSTLDAGMGGTELHSALQATLNARDKDSDTEIIVLTDGEIWGTEQVFNLIRDERKKQSENNKEFRLFSIGLGNGVDRNLVEGMAEAGNGYAAFVGEGEAFEGKVVKMLKTALSERLLNVQFQLRDSEGRVIDDKADKEDGYDSDFTIVDTPKTTPPASPPKKLSLFNESSDDDDDKLEPSPAASKGEPLKRLTPPNPLRAPHELSSLLSGHRSIVYFLQAPTPLSKTLDPHDVIFTAKTNSGDTLELVIPISKTPKSDNKDTNTTIHKLAARRLIKEMEQGSTWIDDALEKQHGIKKADSPSTYKRYVDREGEAIAMKWQILSKWTSFIVVDEEGKKVEEEAQAEPVVTEKIDKPSRLSSVVGFGAPKSSLFGAPASASVPFGSSAASAFGGLRESCKAPVRSRGGGGLFGSAQPQYQQQQLQQESVEFESESLVVTASESNKSKSGVFGSAKNMFSSAKKSFSRSSPSGAERFSPAPSGLFGSPQPPAPLGGLFGAPQPTASSGFFAPTQAAPAPPSGGLFGSSTASFGAPQPQASPAPAPGGLFGSSTTLFGAASPAPLARKASAPSADLFGAPPPAPPVLSAESTMLFGGPPPPQASPAPGGTLFGGAPSSQPKTSDKLPSDPKALTLELLKLASFSGAFNIAQIDFSDFQVSRDTSISTILAQKGIRKPDSTSEKEWDTFCETVLVIVILKEKCASEEDVWELVVEKAESWVEERADEWGVDGKVRERVWGIVRGVVGDEEKGVDGIL